MISAPLFLNVVYCLLDSPPALSIRSNAQISWRRVLYVGFQDALRADLRFSGNTSAVFASVVRPRGFWASHLCTRALDRVTGSVLLHIICGNISAHCRHIKQIPPFGDNNKILFHANDLRCFLQKFAFFLLPTTEI